jgi:hypothetical protein
MIFTKQFLGILILFFHINCYFHPISQSIVDSLKKDEDILNTLLRLQIVTRAISVTTGTTGIKISLQPILSESYPNFSELSGIAYDKINDNLFYVISKTGNNEIKRLNISTGVSTSVYDYNSQLDYGLRYINGNLYLIRTYDDKISILGNLTQSPISLITEYSLTTQSNVSDLSIISNNIYFITGLFTVGGGFKGIQYLPSPNFNSILTLFTSTGGGWDATSAVNRSILSVGSSDQKIVITTGYNGSIELRALDGTLIRSENYLTSQKNYLEKDSKNRIYTIDPLKLTRWDENLQNKETYSFDTSVNLNLSGNGYIFIIREVGDKIEIILVNIRSNSPIFYKGVIPN